jgi:hypothetical protein
MTQREIFRVEKLPVLQNRVFDTADAARTSAVGDVVLVEDGKTGLVYNAAFDPSLISYDNAYQNEQACSEVFRKHLDEVVDIIGRHMRGQSLVEIGCGKGHFLNHLRSQNYTITGVDPAYEGDDPAIIKALFTRGLGLAPEGLILRHVLEHILDPMAFLSLIASENGNKGLVYIEVPCFEWICQNRAWFDIYYEHVNYFRLTDFGRMFGTILESGHVFGGQYIYLVADLSSLRMPVMDDATAVEFPEDFMLSIDRISSFANNDHRNVVWSGASKGVIFAVYMARAGVKLDFAIDINPAKQGKFLAASGLAVLSPTEADRQLSRLDNVFVMNSNYMDEIVTQSGGKYNYYGVGHV